MLSKSEVVSYDIRLDNHNYICFTSNNKKVKASLVYPYKRGTKWCVYHDGEDHEFRTFEMADDFARMINIDIIQALRSK